MNTLLRTMTRQSIIGFGDYRYHKVQDLLNTRKHKELLQHYYFLEKINFTEDVLTELMITPERRINKPGKIKGQYGFINKCMRDLRDIDTNQDKCMARKENAHQNKMRKVINKVIEGRISVKLLNAGWQQRIKK